MDDKKKNSGTDDVQVKHLPNTTGGVVDSAALSRIVADAVAEALKAAIPAAAVGIQAAQNQATETSRAALVREVMRRTKRCPICGQQETACGGAFKKDASGNDIIEKNDDGSPKYVPEANHVKAFVGPKDDNLFRWFQGVIVNGVRYLSPFPGAPIWIPIKSDILTIAAGWEQNEKDLMQKRTAQGSGAGTVGPGGKVPGAANYVGWR